MLFTYPVAATTNNWLHDSLRDAVRTIHAAAEAGTATPAWPDIFPVAHRTTLKKRRALRDRLTQYETAARLLNPAQHQQILIALDEQNRVSDLLSGVCDCDRCDRLPAHIQEPAKELFAEGFRLLTEFGIRDAQYQSIYASLDSKACPFCGCEYFDAPQAPREALDHYLAKSIYPYAGTNLRNLAPIGTKCNSNYKKDRDVIRAANVARLAFDPYGNGSASVSLVQSVPFAGTDGDTPDWIVDFVPASQQAETWDAVVEIRTRYRRDILDQTFKTWLGWFGDWCRSGAGSPTDGPTLLSALDRYLAMLKSKGHSDRAFLQFAVFEFLRLQCQTGNTRLVNLLLDVAKPTATLPPLPR